VGNVKVTLAVGIALTVVVGAVTLTRSPPRVLRVGVPARSVVAFTTHDATVCQANEVLPSEVSDIRLSLVAFYGSSLRLMAFRGSRVLTEGTRGPDWTGKSVTVPVEPVDRTTSQVRLCFALAPNSEPVRLAGVPTPASDAAVVVKGMPTSTVGSVGRPLGGRVGVEYLAAGRGSWWSRALAVARHIGIGHTFGGTWIALLIAALMAAVSALAVGLALRELP
jgi:hypothetical protein